MQTARSLAASATMRVLVQRVTSAAVRVDGEVCRDATKMNKRAGLLNKLLSTANYRFLTVNLLLTSGLIRSSARSALLVLTSVSFTLPAAAA